MKGLALISPGSITLPLPSILKVRYKKNPIRKTILLRIAEDPGKQRERMCISEHPFGTLKRYSGADYVLCKGIKKTPGELGLSFLAYNLKRMIKMMGVREIETAMRGV